MHIIFTVHGLLGQPKHHFNVQRILTKYAKKQNKDIAIIISTSNTFSKTISSISVCGLRLANEIKKEFILVCKSFKERREKRKKTKNQNTKNNAKLSESLPIIQQFDLLDRQSSKVESFDIEKEEKNQIYFSIIGHSLGGLIVRYALYFLYKENWFAKNDVICKNFVTFATPHLGARKVDSQNTFDKIFNKFMIYLGKSCDELALNDAKEGDEPLLVKMTSKEFLKPLQLFQQRILYGNLLFDWKVDFESALIVPNCRDNDLLKIQLGKRLKLKQTTKAIHSQKVNNKKKNNYRLDNDQNNDPDKIKKQKLSLKWDHFMTNSGSSDNSGNTSRFFGTEDEDSKIENNRSKKKKNKKFKKKMKKKKYSFPKQEIDNFQNKFLIPNEDLEKLKFFKGDIKKKNYFGNDRHKKHFIKMLERFDKVKWERRAFWFQDKSMLKKFFVHERMLQLVTRFDKIGFLLLHSFASEFDF
ncbi:alpha/beta-hydrolases superfamily protein [Anaeramoeba flamelloides]|uniref:Alpha/beta-hydrolases superfamily protein n=1 Tax=Anaeramoeba flamelloides TaxID=1746091 RepID=A0AAV7Z4C7_9EUKA|nr:alpha/beta-hydrolases superfamily protein [Anaeramoeba flamelloides]